MKQLLTIKHWQIFILLIGIPMIFQFILMGSIIMGNNSRIIFTAFPMLTVLFTGLIFSWFYALGTNLYKRLPETAEMNLTRFKIALVLPIAYILALSVFMFSIFCNISGGEKPNLVIFAFIVPLHLISMVCIFYCLYFNAKALKTVELQRPVEFGEYIGEFFMFWFFPVGIWILQPRLNKLFRPGNTVGLALHHL